MAKKIGTITHVYGKIGVAVIKLDSSLKIDQNVTIKRKSGEEFEQVISSMQIDRAPIQEAKKGDDIGVKLDQVAKPGDELFEAE